MRIGELWVRPDGQLTLCGLTGAMIPTGKIGAEDEWLLLIGLSQRSVGFACLEGTGGLQRAVRDGHFHAKSSHWLSVYRGCLGGGDAGLGVEIRVGPVGVAVVKIGECSDGVDFESKRLGEALVWWSQEDFHAIIPPGLVLRAGVDGADIVILTVKSDIEVISVMEQGYLGGLGIVGGGGPEVLQVDADGIVPCGIFTGAIQRLGRGGVGDDERGNIIPRGNR